MLKGKISHCRCCHSASGVHGIEKLHKNLSKCLKGTFNSCLMHDPVIPNFYFAKLESNPFLTILTGVALHQKVA